MSLYVQPENQELLWKTIQKLPNCHLIPQGDRENWFKNTVKIIYENNRNKKISSTDLKELNKQTIQNMAQTLNSHILKQNTKKNQNNINYSISVNNVLQNPMLDTLIRPIQPVSSLSNDNGVKGIRQEGFTMEVANRQREYDNMMKREVPPEPNFKEEIDEQSISNMEELLQQQLKLRELDIQPMLSLQSKGKKQVVFNEKIDLSGNNVHVDVEQIPVVNDSITNPLIEFHYKLDILFEIVKNIQTELSVIKRGIIMEFSNLNNNLGFVKPSVPSVSIEQSLPSESIVTNVTNDTKIVEDILIGLVENSP